MEIKINNLPVGWSIVNLGDIAEFIMGQAPPGKDCNKDGIGTIFVKAGEFGPTRPVIREWTTKPLKFSKSGDVLICVVGATSGKLNIGIDCAIGRSVAAIRLLQGVKNTFIYFQLIPKIFELRNNTVGSAQGVISKTDLNNILINIPSTNEQHRIVDKIEELFSELDNGLENLKKAQVQLKTYRQAVLKYAFEGKLTEEWRKKNNPEPAEKLLKQIKAEREKHYQQQLKDWEKACKQAKAEGTKKPAKPKKPKELPPLTDVELNVLPELPEGWVWVKIGNVSLGVGYGSSAKSKKTGKIPVLRMGNIQNSIFDWTDLVFSDDDDEINKYLLKNNDVLFNRTNSPELVGKTGIYQGERPAIFAGYLIRINQINELMSAKFLNHFLNSVFAKNHGNKVKTDGVNQSNINGAKLSNYPFPYTSSSEQRIIVEEIESRLSVCDNIEQSIEDSLKQAEALRQSILKKAFEGKLVPQDPNDEPAEKLLERIKAEKEKLEAEMKSKKKTVKKRKKATA